MEWYSGMGWRKKFEGCYMQTSYMGYCLPCLETKKMLLFIKTTMEVWLYHPKHGCLRRHPPMSGLRWRNGSHHLFRSRNQTNLYVEVYTPNLESDEFGNVLSTQACQAKWASLYLCICCHILIGPLQGTFLIIQQLSQSRGHVRKPHQANKVTY